MADVSDVQGTEKIKNIENVKNVAFIMLIGCYQNLTMENGVTDEKIA